MKKILTLMVVLGIVFFMMPLNAFATSTEIASGTCGENLTWVLTEDGTLTVSGEGEMEGYAVGYPGWYKYRNQLTNVVIQSGVTSVGQSAFYNCTNINSVTLADTVTLLDRGAFVNCDNLVNIDLKNVSVIGDNAFANCGLVEVIIPYGVEKIDYFTFSRCTDLTSITLPESIVTIRSAAFNGCSGLTSINLPKSIKSVDTDAFEGCTSLTNVTIPHNVAIVVHDAFEGTPYHQSITDADGFSVIGDVLIDYSGNGGDIELPACVTHIGDSAFSECDSITSVIIPDTVTTIGKSAFYVCKNMTEVRLSENLKSIGDSAFSDCYNLEEIRLPDSTESIGSSCFVGCNFISFVIPQNLTSIGDGVFDSLFFLEEIVVDKANPVYSSQDGILFNKDMTELIKFPNGKADYYEYTIPGHVERIAACAFLQNEYIESVTIPKSVNYIGPLAFTRAFGLSGITVDPENPAYKSVNGVLFDKEMTTLLAFPDHGDNHYEIPEGVLHIGESAFDNVRLASVTIPGSVRTIGSESFSCLYGSYIVFEGGAPEVIESDAFSMTEATVYYPADNETWTEAVMRDYGGTLTWVSGIPSGTPNVCGVNLTWELSEDGTLTISGIGEMYDFDYENTPPWENQKGNIEKVIIEDGVTSIGDFAFDSMWSLKDVSLPNTLVRIGSYAFSGCALTKVDLPDNVECIEYAAFDGNHYADVRIPASVSYIGESAFSGPNLKKITVDPLNTWYTNDELGALLNKEKTHLIQVPSQMFGSYTVPDTVKTIETGAFRSSQLETVILPEGLNTIFTHAFAFSEIETLHIPASVSGIDPDAFFYCDSLKNLSIDESNPYYSLDDQNALYNKEKTILYDIIGVSPFYVAPLSLETIESSSVSNVFCTCVAFGENVSRINDYAIGSGVKYIFFTGDAPEVIESSAFSSIYSEACIYYPQDNATWTSSVMQDYGGNVTWIAYDPNDIKITGTCGNNLNWEMTFDGTLTIFGTGDMYDFEVGESPWWDSFMYGIRKVVIEDGVTSIGDWAFAECYILESVEMPEGITRIGDYAFLNCHKITNIAIPDDVTAIGESAFMYCYSLTSITLPYGVSSIGLSAFGGMESLTDFSVDPANQYYSSDDQNALYNKDQSVLYMVPMYRTEYTTPESVETIESNAFVSNFTSVILGENISRINAYAFARCGQIENLYFSGDAPATIEENAFYGTEATIHYPANNATWTEDVMQSYGGEITWIPYDETPDNACGEALSWVLNEDGTLTVSGTGAMYDYAAGTAPWYDQRNRINNVVVAEGVTTIGEYAFYDLTNVGSNAVAPASVGVRAVTGNGFHLPETLKSIGAGAFSGCYGVRVIEFPATVESIGSEAFSGCAALKEITFQGDAPEIGEAAFENVDAQVIYPADNETWTENVKENYGGNLIWDDGVKAYSITWVEAYSSLGGNIAVVFKAELSKDLAEDPNAFMRFTYAGKTVEIPVSEATKSGKYHNFYCRIASINMTDDITAQMMVGDEAIGRSATTSLEKYCSYILSTSKDAKTLNLMKAMLNYGAAAQKMMKYKLDNLANKGLSEADKALTKVDASGFKHNLTGSEAGIKAAEAMLVLGSETTIRIGFQLTGSKTIDEYTFIVDGVEAEPVYKGGMYRLEVPNIAAHKLDEYHTFTCGDITITYCGLSYVNQIMKNYTEGTTFDMAVALYNYSQATEAFIS